MAKKVTAANFLKNMGLEEAEAQEKTPAAVAAGKAPPLRGDRGGLNRADLKHFGGYIGEETAEQIAILRARLKLDNSQLIERAMREFYDRETAARKFGDR